MLETLRNNTKTQIIMDRYALSVYDMIANETKWQLLCGCRDNIFTAGLTLI